MLDKERRVLEARIDVFLQHLQTLFIRRQSNCQRLWEPVQRISILLRACPSFNTGEQRAGVGRKFQTGWFHLSALCRLSGGASRFMAG